jgi:hypothetical protein
MVTIRFTQDRVVQDGDQGTPHETRFSAGQVVDLAEASANHWLSRGAAERVLTVEEPAASPTEEPTPPAPSASSAEAQPSLDLTGAPVGDEDGPATDAAVGDDDSGSADEASAGTSEANAEEAGSSTDGAQPGLDLTGLPSGGESDTGDGGSPDSGQAADGGAPGGGQAGASGKTERKPARASAKAVKA